MTAPAPSPASQLPEDCPQGGPAVDRGKRSRRLYVYWGICLTLLVLAALAGLNWKAFHLAYCRHLMRSSDPEKRLAGLQRVATHHFEKGMSRQDISRLVQPLKIEVLSERRNKRVAAFYIVRTWAEGNNGQGLQIHFKDGSFEGYNGTRCEQYTGRWGTRITVGRPGSDDSMSLSLGDFVKTDIDEWTGQHR